MPLPFTVEQFYDVFRDYHKTLWPAPVFLTALALVVVGLMLRPRRWTGVAISSILALLWAWIALAYHLAFFTRISMPAYGFAAVSLAGALVFLWQGVFLRRLQFRWVGSVRAVAGAALVGFSLVVYPAWSFLAGHLYPAMPSFGLPCPTTIFTMGVLAFAVPPYPRSPLVVPVLWCVVGAQAAFLLGVPQDLGLVVAGVVGVVLMVRSKVSVAAAQAGATAIVRT